MLVLTAELFPLARIQSLSADSILAIRDKVLSFGNYCALKCALVMPLDRLRSAPNRHIIALNSECGQVGGCDAASDVDKFTKVKVAARKKQPVSVPVACTLAYFHRPLFSLMPVT